MELGLSEQRILLDENLEAVLLQQGGNGLQVGLLIHFDDHLPYLGPVAGAEPLEHIQFALLDVDLEEIDAVDALVCNDAGQGPERRREGLGGETLFKTPSLIFTTGRFSSYR